MSILSPVESSHVSNLTLALRNNSDDPKTRLTNIDGKSLKEQNLDKINWCDLIENPSIFQLDYQALQQRIEVFKEELIQKQVVLYQKEILLPQS